MQKKSKLKPESEVLKECMLALSMSGCRIWRNQSGAYKDMHGQWIRYGIGNPGGSDLIGITKEGKFIAVEAKKEGWKPPKNPDARTKRQINFIEAIKSMNGIGFFATDAEEAIEILKEQSRIWTK